MVNGVAWDGSIVARLSRGIGLFFEFFFFFAYEVCAFAPTRNKFLFVRVTRESIQVLSLSPRRREPSCYPTQDQQGICALTSHLTRDR